MIWVRFLVLFALTPLIISSKINQPPKKYTEILAKNKEKFKENTDKLSSRLSKFRNRPRRQMSDEFVDEFANDDLPDQTNFLMDDEQRMRNAEEIPRPSEDNFEDFDSRNAEADAHSHSHSHSHVHTHQHSHFRGDHQLLPLLPTQITAPGINLNVHQNQQQQLYTSPIINHQGNIYPQNSNQGFHQNQNQGFQQNINQGFHQNQQQVFQQSQSQSQNFQTLRENQELNNFQNEGDGQAFDPFNQVEEVMDFLSRHPTRLENNQLFSSNFRTPVLPSYYHGIGSIFSKNSESPTFKQTLGSPALFSWTPRRDSRYYDARISDLSKRSLDNFNSIKQKLDENCKKLLKNPFDKIIRVKKSVPLVRLMTDPNAKLDIPKTLENFGTITREAFEDERAPMYHVKNLIGSGKNTFLSAMRIPPQNLVIPSDYEIVKAIEDGNSDMIGGINPEVFSKKLNKVITSRSKSNEEEPIFENSPNFSHTFKRVGEIVRDSIKSGQDTASHIGDIAHDARNILKTARHSAPRFILPISRIPAVKQASRPPPVLITPRIFDLAEKPLLGASKSRERPNFVKLGHIMDAVGISNPSSSKINLEKIILEPKLLKMRMSEAKESAKLAKLMQKFNENADIIDDTVGDTIGTLEDAKVSIGARNFRDFLIKMKKELTGIITNDGSYETRKKKHHSHHKTKKVSEEDREVGKFIETLFNKSRNKPQKDDKVGLYLPPELMKPFMGRASSKDLKTYFRDNGDEENVKKGNNLVGVALDDGTLHDFIGYLQNRESSSNPPQNNQRVQSRSKFAEDDEQILGAINPLMFERLYNQTLKVKNDSKIQNPQDFFLRASPPSDLEIINPQENENATVGTVVPQIKGNMVKPFMGQARPQVLQDFYESYNNPDEIIPMERQVYDSYEE